MKTWLIPTLLLTFSDPSAALADWQAKMLTRYTQSGQEPTEMDGKIYVQGSKVRLDVTAPTEMSIIYDQNTKASTALIHAAKIRLDGGFEQYQDRIPVCLPGQSESCFKKMGVKKIRSETLDGQPCDVYQGKGLKKSHGKPEDYDITLWHPVKEKEVIALRTIVETRGGDRVETHFRDVVVKPVESSTFTIPKGYVKAGGLEQMLKGLKGFSGD